MKISIIGAGNIGGTLTRRFRALGHEVFVANSRGPETLRELAKETVAKRSFSANWCGFELPISLRAAWAAVGSFMARTPSSIKVSKMC